MIRSVQDHSIPPDRAAFLAAEPPTGRVIIIAPTRAACETIEIAVGLHLKTYLESTHGPRVRELARGGKGFGIVAGTGTGKTLAIRPIAQEILRAPLRVGVVNREREATPELANLNVIVVTTGVARRWFQDGDILAKDTLIVDEIHQTSAELELCLGLGKRVGCRFIWLSATVDPAFYRAYLNSSDVLEVYSFDPKKAADVQVINASPLHFLNERFATRVLREQRGVGMFLPTRAGVEQAAAEVRGRFPRINAAYYHGGEPISVIRPFLEEGGIQKPYLLAMTAAGQSALNVHGLDTVIIEDMRFTNVIENGRNVLTRLHLGSNEILQMAGRVHGRVEGGRVFILSDRDIDFKTLRPTAPEFQLAGDSERMALTCADLGVRADELELPVPLDRVAYRRALKELQKRGIIAENGRLTTYGKAVEALPVDRPWAELIVNADNDLIPCLAVMSSIESLHRMTREERNLNGLLIMGSDHLTAYNLYAEAYQVAGFIGEVYGLPRHFFDAERIQKWATERGVLVKSLEDAALAMASVLRSVKIPLPAKMPLANDRTLRQFTELLAQWMPFDLAIDEQTADRQSARVSKTSVCGTRGAIAGSLRYFADRFGVSRASIEGTQIPYEQIRRYATRSSAELNYSPRRKHSPLVRAWKVKYSGFELDAREEPINEFSPEIALEARRVLAEALARFDAQHMAVHKNHEQISLVNEFYKRSGGSTPRLHFAELCDFYEQQLNELQINSLAEFRKARLSICAADFVSEELQTQLKALPDSVEIEDRAVEVDYDVEINGAQNVGVARLKLPEKLARVLTPEKLPQFDRPLRFSVSRGSRGAVRASTLEALQEMLQGPWTPNVTAGHGEIKEEKIEERAGVLPKNRHRGLPKGAPKKRGRVGPPKRAGRRRPR